MKQKNNILKLLLINITTLSFGMKEDPQGPLYYWDMKSYEEACKIREQEEKEGKKEKEQEPKILELIINSEHKYTESLIDVATLYERFWQYGPNNEVEKKKILDIYKEVKSLQTKHSNFRKAMESEYEYLLKMINEMDIDRYAKYAKKCKHYQVQIMINREYQEIYHRHLTILIKYFENNFDVRAIKQNQINENKYGSYIIWITYLKCIEYVVDNFGNTLDLMQRLLLQNYLPEYSAAYIENPAVYSHVYAKNEIEYNSDMFNMPPLYIVESSNKNIKTNINHKYGNCQIADQLLKVYTKEVAPKIHAAHNSLITTIEKKFTEYKEHINKN